MSIVHIANNSLSYFVNNVQFTFVTPHQTGFAFILAAHL